MSNKRKKLESESILRRTCIRETRIDRPASGEASEQERAKLTPQQVLEIWKHFANTGGVDKERMVTIATWLLALSATAIGYAVTHFIEFNPALQVKEGEKAAAAALAILGLFVSFAGILIVLLYAGYSNWNWAKADELARKYGLHELLPETCRAKNARPKRLNRLVLPIASFLAKPKDPRTGFAPVFWIFLALAGVSFLVHAFLLGVGQ